MKHKTMLTIDTGPRIPTANKEDPSDRDFQFHYCVIGHDSKPFEGSITVRCSNWIWSTGGAGQDDDGEVLRAVARELAGEMIERAMKARETVPETAALSDQHYKRIKQKQVERGEKYAKSDVSVNRRTTTV